MRNFRNRTNKSIGLLGLCLFAAVACGTDQAKEDVCATYAAKASACGQDNNAQHAQTFLTTCRKDTATSSACKDAMSIAATCLASHTCSEINAGTACGEELTAAGLACPNTTTGETAPTADPNTP